MVHADYRTYLLSPGWRARADAALARSGYRCQVCGVDRWFARLNVHHNTYANLGHERPEDLVVLCRRCHEIFHQYGSLA